MKRWRRILAHLFLIFFVCLWLLPLYLAVVAASHEGKVMMHAPIPLLPGGVFFHNMFKVLIQGQWATGGEPVLSLLFNSFLMAFCIAFGKILLALGSAFSLVYFDFPFKKICFALILSSMMLPIEVRIIPTFQVAVSFGLLNSFSGLTMPLLACATGTFLFRQFFKSLPKELVEAAKLDGAGPLRFFFDILLPLSKAQLSALFVILFVYGWNQYLWPLVITSEPKMATIVMGIRNLAGVADQIPQWHYIMSVALLALIPPCLLIILMQKSFEKGLS